MKVSSRLKFLLYLSCIYLLVSIFFYFSLIKYNSYLKGKTTIEIMLYNGGESWNFLIISAFLTLLGIFIIWSFWHYRSNISNFTELFIVIIVVIILIIAIFAIILAINNPILRSALAFIAVVGIGVASVNS